MIRYAYAVFLLLVLLALPWVAYWIVMALIEKKESRRTCHD